MESRRTPHCTAAHSQQTPLFLVIAGLVEVVVACVIVVGFFASASQPFSWSSVLQFGGSGLLGALLWYADRTLIVEQSPTSERTRVVRNTHETQLMGAGVPAAYRHRAQAGETAGAA